MKREDCKHGTLVLVTGWVCGNWRGEIVGEPYDAPLGKVEVLVRARDGAVFGTFIESLVKRRKQKPSQS